ncbi:NAD(P)-dependent dehydrogenase (short-subunit alcohol dehydrogenase family) [Paucimonas lemoignei]|uniref:NAD(P)-dependent dehydrogenase (Short-subunit alcohol dehydrogenase family) n=1 Tax=Paucimonas lemoignei TaxID=29443 RepID=A0A4R3I1I4_PAULE|nr:short-chain dehydrogenase/reductase [Paucimonas lemoignei]TCS39064.1 NAD(P)-dependent dehydrogenase (short-subunit alcohol dehydrogenase family) [Paucimonas lemoignei]
MDLQLAGKTALITGASRGIGRAIALKLASEGIGEVILVARDAKALDEVAETIRKQYGSGVQTMATDLAAAGAAQAVVARFSQVDILVNNAADSLPGTLEGTSDREWRSSTELKIFSYVELVRACYAEMKKRGSGVILNNIGSAGENWDAAYVIGSTLNAAMMAFTRATGGVSLDDGIRVVGVNPGPVATDRIMRLMKRRAKDNFGDESRWQEFFGNLPAKRAATPDEVADLFAFLASPLAGYISGTIVTIDGGNASRRKTM